MAVFFIELIVFFLIDVLLHWTGEVLVYLCTFGRQKPVFRMWSEKKSASRDQFPQLSILLGLAFWIAVLVVCRNLPS
jgi:hypothetical protein